MIDSKFDGIRPYNDAEASEAASRVLSSRYLRYVENFLFPDKPQGYIQSLFEGVDSVDNFQVKVMSKVIERIMKGTTNGVTISGLENLIKSDGSYGSFVLLSTHRDIVLDPGLLQYMLYVNGMPRTEIAVGDNLIINQDIEDIMRSNRMIKVIRNQQPRELLKFSMLLSEYLHDSVVNRGTSVWIAHRQGRTKDGNDKTSTGLLKMVGMYSGSSFVEKFMQVPVIPVSISYEYETCAALKAMELIAKERDGFYNKQPNEDLNSMIKGIIQHKGRVHIAICKPFSEEELAKMYEVGKKDCYKIMSDMVDERLMASFKLWPSNYIAADMINGNSNFSEYYTEEDKEKFINHLNDECQGLPEEVFNRVLHIYAAHLLK